MTATTEELDLTEVLAYRHVATPLWNKLLDDYDADVIRGINEPLASWAAVALDGTADSEPEEGEYPDVSGGGVPAAPVVPPAEPLATP